MTADEIRSRRVPVLRVPIARVAAGLADVRGEPRDDAELVDQVRRGERLTILAGSRGWSFVQAREDHYFGWIREEHLTETDEVPASAVVAVALATVAARDGRAIDVVPAGTWVDGGDENGDLVAAGDGWLRAADLVRAETLPLRPPTPPDVIAAARCFLGVPYLWGGTTAKGIDCSGFVQLSYRLCGVLLPRDADIQAVSGRPAEGALRAGDLLFFGAPVDHVTMATSATAMIEAAGGTIGRVVERETASRGTPVAVRRFLP